MRPTANLAPASKLLPVSGLTLTLGDDAAHGRRPGEEHLLQVRVTVAAAEADERADAARLIGDEADVPRQRLARVGGAVRIGQGRGIDRRRRTGHD